MKYYLQLEQHYNEIKNLTNISSMLGWDSAAMMPDGGGNARSDQVTALALIIHEKETNPRLAELIANSKNQAAELNEWQRANLIAMEHSYVHANAIPVDLAESVTKAGIECELLWRIARKENNYKKILPSFKEVLKQTRQVAAVTAESLKLSPYDALLDKYDPGRKSSEVEQLFTELQSFLHGFIPEVLEKQQQLPKIVPLQPPFCTDKQKKLALDLMQMLGFDFNHGRLDVSHHPFCGGTHRDVRITTRYNEQEFISAMEGIIHETGHALYEQNLPVEYTNQPVGDAMGMSIHESESLIMEMQACRSKEFINYIQPKIVTLFGEGRADLTVENIASLVHKVEPSLIRVDADEVTYPAHVILRYKLEKAMIEGSLEAEDLPTAWSEAMQSHLGIVPSDDKDGCMQDIHWYSGAFGYFPTYVYGSVIAAQLFNSARLAHPDLMQDIGIGNFSSLRSWLKTNIHSQGSKYRANELVRRATGIEIGVADYIANLRQRYL